MISKPDILVRGELARLIPVVADTSREQRAVAVLLAALRSVKEFRQAMLASLGIRVGNRTSLEAWTEVSFTSDEKLSKADRPDGLIVLTTGKKQWRAMIEAKIGNNEIGEEQLKTYLQIAKQHKIDAVITITNQFVALPSHHPVRIPKALLKGVDLYHWSWMYAVTQASLLIDQGSIASGDQHFILDEVKRHLSHPSSGISRFTSMNREWSDVVNKIRSKAVLNKGAEEVENTVSAWHQEQRDLCLIMTEKLSQPVKLKLSRVHIADPVQRLKDDCELLAREAILRCILEVPNAASEIEVTADLRSLQIITSMKVAAPQDRQRSTARTNWLIRQIAKAQTKDIHIRALRPGRAEDTTAPLETVLADAASLDSSGTSVPPSGFQVFHCANLAGSFNKPRKFIDELERVVPLFYEQIGQRLRVWVAPPPKVKPKQPTELTAGSALTVDVSDAETQGQHAAAEQHEKVEAKEGNAAETLLITYDTSGFDAAVGVIRPSDLTTEE